MRPHRSCLIADAIGLNPNPPLREVTRLDNQFQFNLKTFFNNILTASSVAWVAFAE
jgi:hypothetical protein